MSNPFLASWRIFAFQTSVELFSDVQLDQTAARLARIIAPPRSFNKVDRKKALRGCVCIDSGTVRWALNDCRFVSPRSLHFRLVVSPDGTTLVGNFRTWTTFRVIVLGWFYFAVVVSLTSFLSELAHSRNSRSMGIDLIAIPSAFGFIFGYAWIAVRVGRSRDRMLVKVLKHTLSGAASAEAVSDLLSN